MSPASATAPRIAPLAVDQVHAMQEAGILGDREPIELIGGVLVYKDRSAVGEQPMTIGRLHDLMVSFLVEFDVELAPRGHCIQIQGSLTLPPHDEPEPDGLIFRGRPRDYVGSRPTAADVAVIIEVADSSLAYDRTTKLSLYARFGLPQYVIVNVRDRVLEIHEEPSESGTYARIMLRRAGETVTLRLGDHRFTFDAARVLP